MPARSRVHLDDGHVRHVGPFFFAAKALAVQPVVQFPHPVGSMTTRIKTVGVTGMNVSTSPKIDFEGLHLTADFFQRLHRGCFVTSPDNEEEESSDGPPGAAAPDAAPAGAVPQTRPTGFRT